VVSSMPWPHFTPGKDLVSIVQEAGWAPGPVWTGGKSCRPGIQSPDRPARSQLLYRLSYLARHLKVHLFNPLNTELNPICYLLALLGAHHFLHVSRIRVKSLTIRLLMPYIYGAPILDVSRSHTTTRHSR